MTPHRVYADHAATTPLSKAAFEAMLPFLRDEFGNPSSLHSWARAPRKAVAEARETIAKCINAEPDEIFFTSGGTESDNWVVKGSTGGLMVSAYEHHAVLNAATSEAAKGREVVYVRPKVGGYLMPETLSKKWTDGIRLVSVMTANNEIGSVNPVRLLSEEAHKRGALFHTDAVQAVGHIPIDVREMGVDFLSASAHKFNGPKGIGFLFVRKGLELASLMNGGQQEGGRRAGTENVASIVGMAAALKESCDNMERNAEHLDDLVVRFCDGAENLAERVVYLGTALGLRLPGFISVAFPGHSAEALVHLLDLKGVAVSAGAACDSKNTQVSHVLKAINAPRAIAESTIRITFGPENTVADVDAVLAALKFALRKQEAIAAKMA